ncbi:hypothetical protein JCM17846_15000 [Iodidimonas nitroreducens]|uniref:Pilus formation protein N-terminal domain-containing protein n=1 Tax=Iodidimonas nitroreducens TaxID=1236968 RepID=A0A5A7N6U1_9PROT|nr:hypothetical protein [Iodidimonas nitroreducens]GER03818.1 hypothetical protein JCM17846_15000 [Iodidimonas nitroreducens]
MLKKRIPLTILAVLMMGAAPSLAEPITQQRDLPAFEKIRIKGAMDANIMVGGSQSVAIRLNRMIRTASKPASKTKR